jgi:SagB-type dehydrogenase family enzyme
MRTITASLLIALLLVMAGSQRVPAETSDGGIVVLSAPRRDGELSVEAALARRRSVRAYTPTPTRLTEISQLLWSAQGVTHAKGFRTAPSAGALYPLELFLVAGNVDGLATGVYRYDPRRHELHRKSTGDRRAALAAAALDQDWIAEAPSILVIGAVYERTESKYRARAARYVHMEVGHAVQNVYLQSEALGLGTCIVGGFDDARVRASLDLPPAVAPLGIMPIGRGR